MPIDVRWLESRILLFKLHPPFTSKALSQALDDSIEMVNAIPNQPVGTVLDVKGLINVPPGALQQGRKLSRVNRANVGPVVLIRAHPIVRGFTRIARTVYPPTGDLIHFADSQERGVLLLRNILNIDAG